LRSHAIPLAVEVRNARPTPLLPFHGAMPTLATFGSRPAPGRRRDVRPAG
jgi:hypothetical protein